MKYYFNSEWTLKKCIFLFVILPMLALNAQPLSGSYTVGGTAPDFIKLQDAANALKWQGVSGPVFINIRPGIYMENGGQGSVMILDSIITGSSTTNRITFKPDAATGGTVENVILQIDLATQSSTALVSIRTNYVTISNITFQDVDLGDAGADFLLSVSEYPGFHPEGIIVEGCLFIGNSHPTGGMEFGTDYGIYADINVSGIEVRNNTFQRLMRAVSIGNSVGITTEAIVEDNQILACHWGTTVTGGWRGYGIMIQAINVIVRRNYLNNTEGRGSLYGIYVQADTGLVERNNILNGPGLIGEPHSPTYSGVTVHGISLWGGVATSMMVVNNSISVSGITPTNNQSSRIGIDVQTKKVEIIHNTILQHSGGGKTRGIGFYPNSDSCTVLNNIIIDYSGTPSWPDDYILFSQTGGEAGLISDYNVFYYQETSPGITIVSRSGTFYSNLNLYQSATGLDSNSIFKQIDFAQYPHLSDCQGQDPELGGIPYPGIVDDIDGDPRSLTAPTRGADEGKLRLNPMFEDVFRYQLSGFPYSMTAGKFDNLMADGLAIADHTNRQVLLFHNLPESRSFVQSGTLQIGFKPTTLAFYDFDDDSNLDLIVGGDTAIVKVFWGDGIGGFPSVSQVETYNATLHLIPEPYRLYDSTQVVFVTHLQLFPPNWQGGYIGLVMNLGNRELCYDRMRAPNSVDPDTIPYSPYWTVVDDINGDNYVDIAGINPAYQNFTSWEFRNFYMLFVPCGNNRIGRQGPFHQFYGVGVAATTTENSIVIGDFDGDTDRDFVTVGSSEYESVLLRNEGDFNFQVESFPVNKGKGFVKLDYDNDGDLDFASANWYLDDNGITVFLNDGTGNFTTELNCYQPLASGIPRGFVARDFDRDGKTDLAIISQGVGGDDSLFVLYSTGNVTGITDEQLSYEPASFSLEQNFPNPFNPSTTIRFEIPEDSKVTLKIFNILGQEVSTLINTDLKAGQHEYQFNSYNLASGIYFYRIQTDSFAQTKKMVLLR